MASPAQPKRFRVALSFPGEHRLRVEEIAEALALNLGRDRVLYDKWYGPEFARPNLDTYLSNLYRDEADLVVVFLCREYNEKEWCGLEWRACRDLLKQRGDTRLMFLRLDGSDIPGIYSIDGYLPIREMADSEVAAAVLSRLGHQLPKVHRAFTAKLPIVNPLLIGRDAQLAFLDRAWEDPTTNFVQIVAAGGTGKTALVDKWFRRHLGEAGVFGWSFYNQGASAGGQTSSDPFFAEIFPWLHIEITPTASIYAKAEAVAKRLREERVLLILDGVEPLQDANGALRDSALKALLQEIDTANRGLVVCTTRVRLDIPDDSPRALSLDLDDLTPEQGAEYLRNLNVKGTDEELQQLSRGYWNHALALTLLGSYLIDFCDGDVRRRIEIPALVEEDSHAHGVIAAYERMFAGKPEIDIMRALGYFDRPAEPAALRLVLPAMDERKYCTALNRLHRARLILTNRPTKDIDCHPLVREHFAAAATPEGHAGLYEHYIKQAPHRPDTIQEMTPLFYAVYHGCRAGKYKAVFDDVYRDRIHRGDEFYLVRKLGAFGTDLSLLANFFETPWTQPVANLSRDVQSEVIGQAGISLRATGRLTDAVELFQAAADACEKAENWKDAAVRWGNLSVLNVTLGNANAAVASASRAVDFANRSNDGLEKVKQYTTLADAFHQFGDVDEARGLFEQAERLQASIKPARPLLHAVYGYRYCDLLLGQHQTLEVLRRASETLKWAEREKVPLDIGLDHLSLGRAHPAHTDEASYNLNQAVDFLRGAGRLDYLPRALLARGTSRDLEEVFRIAIRSGMRLHLTDYHLAVARLALDRGDLAQTREHLFEAEALVHETGYQRRERELAELRSQSSSAGATMDRHPGDSVPRPAGA
jgi:tetratricopeptide (TPR) repeat protein